MKNDIETLKALATSKKITETRRSKKSQKLPVNIALDLTFLNNDQIWGEGALDIIKHYGTKVAPIRCADAPIIQDLQTFPSIVELNKQMRSIQHDDKEGYALLKKMFLYSRF